MPFPKTLKRAADFRNQPADVTYANWRSQIEDAITAADDAASEIVNRAKREGREARASEAREFEELSDERAKLEGVREALDAEMERKGISSADEAVRTPSGLARGVRIQGAPDVPASLRGNGDAAEWSADGMPLPEGRSMAEWAQARGMVEQYEQPLDFGKYLRGMVTGEWKNAEAEKRAMSEGVLSGGGYMVPTPLSTRIIDLARNRTRVLQAGAQVVPMGSSTLKVAKWTGDPGVAWHTENATITPSDGTLGSITLTAHSLSTIVTTSFELIEDANGIEERLLEAFAAKFALTTDYAAMYGSGTDPEPRGVKNTTGITVQPLGTGNGATPANYLFLVDAIGALQDANEDPNAVIMAPRTERTLAKLIDGMNQPMRAPQMVQDVPRYTTNQVPVNLTLGTANNTSDVFVGDWRQLIVGVRTGLQIQVLRERYADTGQIGFLAWWRGDIAVARPAAFDVVTGVLP